MATARPPLVHLTICSLGMRRPRLDRYIVRGTWRAWMRSASSPRKGQGRSSQLGEPDAAIEVPHLCTDPSTKGSQLGER
jgi:hypothetical protein